VRLRPQAERDRALRDHVETWSVWLRAGTLRGLR
jgi:hypothetical protein